MTSRVDSIFMSVSGLMCSKHSRAERRFSESVRLSLS